MSRALVPVFILFLSGTLSAAPPPKGLPRKELYYPTQVGAKWVYEYSGHDTTIVVSKVEKDAKGTLVTCDYVTDGKQTPCHKYRVSEAGVWMTEEVGEEYEPAWQLFKAPYKADDKWEFLAKRKAMQISGNYTLSDQEDVVVPAGKFKAIKVTCTNFCVGQGGGTSIHVNWYAPDVGEVKRVDGNGKPIRTLKSFTAGKD